MSYNKNNTRNVKNQVQNTCKNSAKQVKCTKKRGKKTKLLTSLYYFGSTMFEEPKQR